MGLEDDPSFEKAEGSSSEKLRISVWSRNKIKQSIIVKGYNSENLKRWCRKDMFSIGEQLKKTLKLYTYEKIALTID